MRGLSLLPPLISPTHRLWRVRDVHGLRPLKGILLGVPLRRCNGVHLRLERRDVRVAALVNAAEGMAVRGGRSESVAHCSKLMRDEGFEYGIDLQP